MSKKTQSLVACLHAQYTIRYNSTISRALEYRRIATSFYRTSAWKQKVQLLLK